MRWSWGAGIVTQCVAAVDHLTMWKEGPLLPDCVDLGLLKLGAIETADKGQSLYLGCKVFFKSLGMF